MIKAHKFYVFQFFFWFVACGPSICPESVFTKIEAIKQVDNNLRFDVVVETSSASNIQINYWKSNGEGDVFLSEISEDTTKHLFTLSRLSPKEKYNFTVVLETEDCQTESKPYEFITGAVPANLTPLLWSEFDSTAFEGFILLQRRTPRGNIHLIDGNGDIVWYQKFEGIVKVSHWTDQSTFLVLYGNDNHKNSAGADIVEYSLSGQKLLHLRLAEKSYIAHHEVRTDSAENVVALIYDTRTFDLTSIGGKASQNVTGDGILIMDKTGKELWKWSVFDHKDPTTDPKLIDHLDDWGHANALSIDSDGNFLISMRDWNQIWKINAKTGEVIWKFGEGGDFEFDENLYFDGQHAIHRNLMGHYMLFDNGRLERKTRILSFALDGAEYAAEPHIVIDLPDEFYADRMGSAYLMENENILVCSPRARSILILNPKGEVLCNAYVGVPDPYRAEYIRSFGVNQVKM